MQLRLVAAIAVALGGSAAADGLSVTFTTTPNGGTYAPKNVVSVWIEDAGGAFVKTIGRWAGVRATDLVAWKTASGLDADAVSGATRADHSMPLTVTWDLKTRAGAIVPDGTYTIRMELADSNTTSAANNHQGTFTFVKSATAQMQSGLANGGFTNVTIDYVVGAACSNGVVDPGETCDGNCPTSCATSADACMPLALVGTAATCDAACVAQPITACVDGDGCCAMGCDATTDSDCGGGGDNNAVIGGCSVGSDRAAPFALLLVFALILHRRRL